MSVASFEFCCPSIALAWRLLHPMHWTDHRHVHPWWLPAIEMANPKAWQVGWWWINWSGLSRQNGRPCLISLLAFCLVWFPLTPLRVRLGEVEHFNEGLKDIVFLGGGALKTMVGWGGMRSTYSYPSTLAPNIPSTKQLWMPRNGW